jgi:hypothetical protein
MMFDSGIPLGPGLLATWVPLPDPPTKNAKARINKAAIATSIPAFVLPLRSFDTRFSFVSSDLLRFCNQRRAFRWFRFPADHRSLTGLRVSVRD